jgi:hypothetical protein
MMTPGYITNQLTFFSNAKFILGFIKSQNSSDVSPPQFSLNSIKPMPESLSLPLNDPILRLSLMNTKMPPLSETVTRLAQSAVYFGNRIPHPESVIEQAIEETRSSLHSADADKPVLDVFEEAVANYRRHQAFCYYDWRLAHWGTIDDIQSVVESTFELPTDFIEFQTKWTPPIRALETLATTFPSVRFELKYRQDPAEPWTKEEIFPNPPFGY